eukprot:TRINITY_DN16602_c0_g1_i1.p1 TRINITY_DN16602_c0_g1~~TRINITY_DN16602_c0_g1_i1.p1  ORF type:complete len:537 (-),score=131.83 TRINITY_DN16602_c0_g1_i1:54-1610(-)
MTHSAMLLQRLRRAWKPSRSLTRSACARMPNCGGLLASKKAGSCSAAWQQAAADDVFYASSAFTGLMAMALVAPAGCFITWWLLRVKQSSPLPLPRALAAAGVRVDERICLRDCGSRGRGIFATSRVPAGTVLLKIPAAAILSGEKACEILGASDLDPQVALCALLAEARREADAGRDTLGLLQYLQELPASFSSLPFCFSDEDLARELGGTALAAAASALKLQAEEERAAAVERLGDRLEALWSPERWQWAKAALLTRAGPRLNIATGSGGGEVSEGCQMIVPLVDFANCALDPTAECRTGADGEVILVARQEIRSGSEVTISYGEQGPEQLLFTFGFLPANAAERLSVASPLPLQDGNSKLRGVLLRLLLLERSDDAGSGMPSARLSWGTDGAVDVSEMWTAANLHAMSEDELKEVAASVTSSGKLPAELAEKLRPSAAQRVRSLLQEWESELVEQPAAAAAAAGSRFAPVRAYKSSCLALVNAALQRSKDEGSVLGLELSAEDIFGSCPVPAESR